jgi:hypothetical protein
MILCAGQVGSSSDESVKLAHRGRQRESEPAFRLPQFRLVAAVRAGQWSAAGRGEVGDEPPRSIGMADRRCELRGKVERGGHRGFEPGPLLIRVYFHSDSMPDGGTATEIGYAIDPSAVD